MKKVFTLNILLLIGLVLSQTLPYVMADYASISHIIKLGTMIALAFIMIHVGYEFEIFKNRLREYGVDYLVAFTAASFPWIFVTLYFVIVLIPGGFGSWDAWKDSLLAARFAAPTSAGVLFSMLAAAGLAATWMFRKTRILAIFDDLDTVLLMIPLQMLIIGFKIQLLVVIVIMAVMVWLAWKYLHALNLSIRWQNVLFYAILIVGAAELIYLSSKMIDAVVPVHIEVLLPAFVLGVMISKKYNLVKHGNTEEDLLEQKHEKRISFIVSAVFMVLVGLSMPLVSGIGANEAKVSEVDQEIVQQYLRGAEYTGAVTGDASFTWGTLLFHVLIVTLLSNIGKMFPAFAYRSQSHWKERLAVAIAMFPRGEVGAGILIISLSYGISGMIVSVAMLSLALNLMLTGVFIIIVKRLMKDVESKNLKGKA